MGKIKVIGGGLAGCECAYQLLKRGHEVELFEMRPSTRTPIHKTENLAELVCSNSLKSVDFGTSQGLLKCEMKELDSLILRSAENSKVPAGGSLAVDREDFSMYIEKELSSFDKLTVTRREIDEIPTDGYTVIATGPLTSDSLAKKLTEITGNDGLAFYDAVAPIVTAESIDETKSFFAGRYGKGGDDYLNCPMTEEEYNIFVSELVSADTVILKEFEKKEIFSACMPVEVMAKRGKDSLRFGPLRPVGLIDPRTGKRPYAVVQLRKENVGCSMYNIVGFQTNLKFGEQKRVFGLIPALSNAEFVRYGVMHRNTFLYAPDILDISLRCKKNKNLFFAGQITGVEGYMESAMSGLICGLQVDRALNDREFLHVPETTAIGSLLKYITTPNSSFQPMHVSYSLLPELEEKVKDKKIRKIKYSERALQDIKTFAMEI